MLKPEENCYIKKAEEQHDYLVNDLGRVEKNLQTKIDKIAIIEQDMYAGKPVAFVEVLEYYNFLVEAMESLVIKPILVVFRRYIKVKKKLTEDTKNNLNIKETREKLFIYWIFLEVYHNSLYVGGITRDTTPKNVGKGVIPQNYPSGIPSDSLGITERDLSQREDSMENLFNNPFEGLEENA